MKTFELTLLFFRTTFVLQAIEQHSGAERKGAFPGGPDDYRETKYERDYENHSFKVMHSIVDNSEIFAKAQ